MRDQFGQDMEKYVVSARLDDVAGQTQLTLTLVLKSRMELRKVDIQKSAFGQDIESSLLSTISEKEFDHKTPDVKKAVRALIRKEPGAGKFFLREAMTVYSVKEKLTHGQIEEVMMGVYLVGGVEQL